MSRWTPAQLAEVLSRNPALRVNRSAAQNTGLGSHPAPEQATGHVMAENSVSTVQCKACEAEFTPRRMSHVHCSKKCTSRTWRKERYPYTRLQCAQCQGGFTRTQSRQRYCSEACSYEARKGQLRTANGDIGSGGHRKGKEFAPRQNCIICGKRFHALPSLMRRGGGKLCSNECKTTYLGTRPQKWGCPSTPRGKGGRRADLDNRFFRSTWEANYARYLNWLLGLGEIARWEYEVDTFEFPIKRGSRFYTPDFKVFDKKGGYVYHEVKGWMDARSKTKLARMKRYHRNQSLIVIDKPVYRSIARQVSKLIPNWEQG